MMAEASSHKAARRLLTGWRVGWVWVGQGLAFAASGGQNHLTLDLAIGHFIERIGRLFQRKTVGNMRLDGARLIHLHQLLQIGLIGLRVARRETRPKTRRQSDSFSTAPN